MCHSALVTSTATCRETWPPQRWPNPAYKYTQSAYPLLFTTTAPSTATLPEVLLEAFLGQKHPGVKGVLRIGRRRVMQMAAVLDEDPKHKHRHASLLSLSLLQPWTLTITGGASGQSQQAPAALASKALCPLTKDQVPWDPARPLGETAL